MINAYIKLLNNHGYIQEYKDVSYAYTRRSGNECYVVMLSECLIADEQLMEERNRITRYYQLLGFKYIYQHCIIIQNNALFSEGLLEHANRITNLWLFADDQKRMYRFEYQPLEFDGLCHAFENIKIEDADSQKLKYKNRFPWMTTLLIVSNLLCYFVPLMFGEYESFIHFGMNQYDAVIGQKQAYRLVTAMFLHAGISHLWNNMLVLGILGSFIEPVLGRLQFFVIYLLSGTFANLFSLCFHTDSVGSIGASGAVFGLSGALLAMAIFYKGKIPGISVRRVICMCLVSLYGGIAAVNVDNAAHIGGLLLGFFLVILTNNIREKCI